jgi:hypothetical protein
MVMTTTMTMTWFDQMLQTIASPLYTWLLVLIYATYISAAFGLWYVYPDAVHSLTNMMQVLIALVLILRFHPFRTTTYNPAFDHRFIFASAILLLINAGLSGFFRQEWMAIDTLVKNDAKNWRPEV